MPDMPLSIRKMFNARCVMRNLFLLFTFQVTLYTFSYAAPCYGTKMPKKTEVFVGAQSYFIFKRHLAGDNGKLRSTQHLFLLSYGVYDWLSLDLKGAAGSIKQHPQGSDELDYPTYVGGGYGFRTRLFEEKNTKIVFGFQHISIHPKSINAGPDKHKGVLDDWQFSTLASYRFKKMSPYIGTRWSRSDYIHWVNGTRKRVKSDTDKSIGLVTGLDFYMSECMWLNVEGQFLDGEAASVSLNYSF